MNCKFLSLISIIFFINCIPSRVFSQTEYFVSLDQQTGNFSKINVLSGVNWIIPNDLAYDQAKHNYFFCGGESKKNWRLYTVEGNSGNVIDSPVFFNFTDTLDNIYGLAYNESDNTIYGLHWSNAVKKEYFISVDPVSGFYTVIKEIPDVKYINPQSLIDKANGTYVFIGYDSAFVARCYSVALNNGNIAFSPLISNHISQLEYDEQLQNIYGLYSKNDSLVTFGTIDVSTGIFDKIAVIPDIKSIAGGGQYYTYNTTNNSYIFVGLDTNNTRFLISINSISGQVSNKIKYQYASNDSDNVICFQYDNILNKLFALHWESKPATIQEINIYPNPFFSQTNIVLRNAYSKIEVLLYSEEGKLVCKQSLTNSSHIILDRYNMASATYYAKVFADNSFIGTIKLIAR